MSARQKSIQRIRNYRNVPLYCHWLSVIMGITDSYEYKPFHWFQQAISILIQFWLFVIHILHAEVIFKFSFIIIGFSSFPSCKILLFSIFLVWEGSRFLWLYKMWLKDTMNLIVECHPKEKQALKNIQVCLHPLYSLDLALCNFSLLHKVEMTKKHKCFQWVYYTEVTMTVLLKTITRKF